MAGKLPPLRYVLPTTVFGVTLTRRVDIEVDAGGGGSFPKASIDVKVEPRITADQASRCLVDLDEELLEKISISAALSEEGVIESIGVEASRDPTPIIALTAKVALVAAQFFLAVQREPQRRLEDDWAAQHKGLADLLSGLTQRIEHHLAVVAADGSSAADVVASGAALQVLHREAAAVDRLRREWIARHASVGEVVRADLTVDDLALLKAKTAVLPQRMVADEFQLPAAWGEIAARHGVVVAIADDQRNWGRPAKPELRTTDQLIMRRPRPVQLGVYRRVRDGQSTGDGGKQFWELHGQPVTLDVIDDYSHYEVISLDGKWFTERKVELSMYPDQSIKTWAVTSASAAGGIATSVGSLVDAVGEIRKQRAERPAPAARELEQAKLKLDLLQTASQYAQLSATHERAAELAELEQRVRLSELSGKA